MERRVLPEVADEGLNRVVHPVVLTFGVARGGVQVDTAAISFA